MFLQVFRPVTLLKSDSNSTVFSCEICEIFKNIYFEEHLRATASKVSKKRYALSTGVTLAEMLFNKQNEFNPELLQKQT